MAKGALLKLISAIDIQPLCWPRLNLIVVIGFPRFASGFQRGDANERLLLFLQSMSTSVRSFAKINIGLKIGPLREDGFHELRTIYQTVAVSDVIRVEVGRGVGIEVYSKDPRVPRDETNTCWRVADRVLRSLKTRGKVRIAIDKNLPVQGGLGAASSNAVATMLALEKALKRRLPSEERLRIAAEVGSDL